MYKKVVSRLEIVFKKKHDALDVVDDPKNLFNGDETSFMICPKTGKMIAPRSYLR